MHNLQKETYRTKDGLVLVYAEERGKTGSWNVVLCNAKTGDSAVLFNTGVLCKNDINLTVFYDEFQNLFYVFSFEADDCSVLKLYDKAFHSCQTLITAKS